MKNEDKLRRRLEQFLNEKDMTFKRASLYFGLSAGALNKFMNDKCKSNKRTIYKIRKGLGLIKKEESATL